MKSIDGTIRAYQNHNYGKGAPIVRILTCIVTRCQIVKNQEMQELSRPTVEESESQQILSGFNMVFGNHSPLSL